MAIAGIDTRRLTRLLREKGAQAGCIVTGEAAADAAAAVAAAGAFPGLAGSDLAREVTVDTPYRWTEGSWQLGSWLCRSAPSASTISAASTQPAEPPPKKVRLDALHEKEGDFTEEFCDCWTISLKEEAQPAEECIDRGLQNDILGLRDQN